MTDDDLDKGWAVYEVANNGTKQIQKIDELGLFETDADAIRFVIRRANAGDKRAQAALEETVETDDLVRDLLAESKK